MGFFKWLDKHIRESNRIADEEAEWRAERDHQWREERKKEELKKRIEELSQMDNCCANCVYYTGRGCEIYGSVSNGGKDCGKYEFGINYVVGFGNIDTD